MARIAFEKIMAGLEDALAYADNDTSRGSAHQVYFCEKRGQIYF